jgi:tetratricopeptide (TPR) repeat protein
VAADHGESLGEHGEDTHGVFLYDSTLRVPLILAGPAVPAGREPAVVARLVDVAPTLLDLAGLPPLAAIDGRSLRPAVEGRPMADEPAYVESLYVQHQLGWAPLHGLRTAAWKLIEAPRPELYALRDDPGETRDRAREESTRVDSLRRGLQLFLSAATPDARADLDPEVAQRLAALGYLGGGPPAIPTTATTRSTGPATGSSAPRASGRDPKDGIALINRLGRGVSEARSRPEDAIRELSAVLAEDPGMRLARRFRALALARAGRHGAAVADLRVIESAGALSADDLVVLADSLRELGRPGEALAALKTAARLEPSAPLPWLTRGNLLLREGRLDEAQAAFERVLALVPDHTEGLRGLGDLAFVRGNLEGSAERYRRLLETEPGDVRALVKLGVVDVRSGRAEEGIARFRRAVEREPANGEALLYLAGALAATGRAPEAIPFFERALAAGPRSTMALNGLAFARLQPGDARGATAAFRESLALDPRQPDVARSLADLASSP